MHHYEVLSAFFLRAFQVDFDTTYTKARTERKWKRTAKRRMARQNKRESSRNPLASAQDATDRHALVRLMIYNNIQIATLNIRGANCILKQFEVEQWMKKNNVQILMLTETKTRTTQQMNRTGFTWYFSSGIAEIDTHTATGEAKIEHHGVGIVINNHIFPCVDNVISDGSRIITIVLKSRKK